MRVRCLIDLDDTLLDYRYEEQAAAAALRDLLPPGADASRWSAAYRQAKDRARLLRPVADEEQYRTRLTLAFTTVGHRPDDRFLDRAVDRYWETRYDSVRLLPQATDVLSFLAGRYEGPVLCTHGIGARQRARLDRAGIAGAFTAVLISGEVGATKADWPRFLGRLYEPGAPYLVISDRVDPDLSAAARLGMDTVLVGGHDPAESAPPGLRRVPALAGLLDVLQGANP
ncbi:HAD family hydrolase [Actinomadura macrotermitis]|uniref:HAD family hydrolase n=1 Tax=Actinomadura macrotermitis TaxID=2585200 RepID=UPI001296CDAC|nr:HAD family hydrolase [Actinomadura macrotermitis]